jgi:membrane protein DedA with SNARE-associated domain
MRSTVPFIAGMMRMDKVRFRFANIGSAIVWAPTFLAMVRGIRHEPLKP